MIVYVFKTMLKVISGGSVTFWTVITISYIVSFYCCPAFARRTRSQRRSKQRTRGCATRLAFHRVSWRAVRSTPSVARVNMHSGTRSSEPRAMKGRTGIRNLLKRRRKEGIYLHYFTNIRGFDNS